MPDNLIVELMRYRTRPKRNYELPLQVRAYMNIVGRAVEIRIDCTVSGTYFTKLNEVHCEDIQIRLPLPDTWVYLFRIEKHFRYGAIHSSKHKFGKIKGLDRLLVNKTVSTNTAVMEASAGMAKYEQAFKSLVWRIDQLPVKNKDIYKRHLFICKFHLQEYDTLPDQFEQTAHVQFSLPICAASKTQVF
jgi:stonin-1/2